jgi:hypothetical protein
MKVRILTPLNGAYGTFAIGSGAELPDEIATAWLAAGVAEAFVEPEAAPEPVDLASTLADAHSEIEALQLHIDQMTAERNQLQARVAELEASAAAAPAAPSIMAGEPHPDAPQTVQVADSDGVRQESHTGYLVSIDHGYCTVQDLKNRKGSGVSGGTIPDATYESVITAVSREIDQMTGRHFYAVDETRVFTARCSDEVLVDDLLSVSELRTDANRDRTYSDLWSPSDFDLSPANASSDARPYWKLEVTPNGSFCFPACLKRGVKVTGSWGYSATTPAVVREACIIACLRLLRRPDSPFGVSGSDTVGGVVRMAVNDPDVKRMLSPVSRRSLA